jgi:hypothetical protein
MPVPSLGFYFPFKVSLLPLLRHCKQCLDALGGASAMLPVLADGVA